MLHGWVMANGVIFLMDLTKQIQDITSGINILLKLWHDIVFSAASCKKCMNFREQPKQTFDPSYFYSALEIAMQHYIGSLSTLHCAVSIHVIYWSRDQLNTLLLL